MNPELKTQLLSIALSASLALHVSAQTSETASPKSPPTIPAQFEALAAKWAGRPLETIRSAAKSGDIDAQNHLGWILSNGRGVTADLPEAAKWFESAAKQGSPLAQYSLGMSYHRGLGVVHDQTEAMNWMRKAADQKFPWGIFGMGKLYEEQTGMTGGAITGDYVRSAEWYSKAADLGIAEAAGRIAFFYGNGNLERNYSEAAKWDKRARELGLVQSTPDNRVQYRNNRLVQAAELGSAAAAFDLADEVTTSPSDNQIATLTSLKWLKASAELGFLPAMRSLAAFYSGERQPWWVESNELSNREYILAVRLRYLHGTEAPRDIAESDRWRIAAGKRLFYISENFSNGLLLPKDLKLASSLCFEAARFGNADADNQIGDWWATGSSNGQRDATEAYGWFRRGAAGGSIAAQFNLAKCFYEGEGVGTNQYLACLWMRIAAARGHSQATNFVSSWEIKLTDSQRTDIKRRTAAYLELQEVRTRGNRSLELNAKQ